MKLLISGEMKLLFRSFKAKYYSMPAGQRCVR